MSDRPVTPFSSLGRIVGATAASLSGGEQVPLAHTMLEKSYQQTSRRRMKLDAMFYVRFTLFTY